MLNIRPNTRMSELYAYMLLKDNLLKDKMSTIGDDIPNGLPDIYSDDKKIGIEVTCVEEKHIYALFYALYKNTSINLDSISEKDFDVNNFKLINKNMTDKRYKKANLQHKMRLKTTSSSIKEKSTKEGVEKALRYVISKKLDRLNNKTSYAACKNIFLFLVSDHITKDFININEYKKIYDDLCKAYEMKFDGVFVALNDKLYFIDGKGKINIITKPNEIRQVRQKSQFRHIEQNITLERDM